MGMSTTHGNLSEPGTFCNRRDANFEEQFREAAAQRGILIKHLIADGELHRCPVEGNRGTKCDGAYLLHLDGLAAGGFQNHRDGGGWETWKADTGGRQWTTAEKLEYKQKLERQKAEREKEGGAKHAAAQKRAAQFLNGKSKPATAEQPYVARKHIKPHGAHVCGTLLLVEGRDVDGELHALQFIAPDGGKTFLKGSRKRECFHVIGAIDLDRPNLVCDGFATAASCHEVTGLAAIVAFDAGNLQPVAEALQERYFEAEFLICADDDWQTVDANGKPINPGLSHAIEAARALLQNGPPALYRRAATGLDGF